MKTFSSINTAARQSGVTLVELMVSLVLGLLLTAGMIKVFSGNRVTYEFNQSLSRIQENARYALDHIAYSARMAGYKGCMSDVAVYNNLNGPNSFRDDIENGITGFDANGTSEGEAFVAAATNPAPSANEADWSPALPAELDGKVIPGSDVIVIRSVGGGGLQLVSPFTNAAQLFVATPHDFVIGEILVVTDCQKASIFQISNIDSTGHNLVHSNTSGFLPGNNGPNWPPEQDYGLGAEVARLQAHAFYIGQGENGVPSLFQLRLQLNTLTSTVEFKPEELVEGIESMQVRYGVDTDSNETIDSWLSADAVANWRDVLSVEINLLARAGEEYGTDTDTAVYTLGSTTFDPVDDRRLRQVFSTTVGVRNRLP
ncbi:MAG TPA: PilW family protein [Woeseiaceae bacterium]|nr:PilW family protein [Woeseiaceae bacterium]